MLLKKISTFILSILVLSASEPTEPHCPRFHTNYYGKFECEDFVFQRHTTYVEVQYGEVLLRGHTVFIPYGKGIWTGVTLNYNMSPKEIAENLLLIGPITQIEPEPLKTHLLRVVPSLRSCVS